MINELGCSPHNASDCAPLIVGDVYVNTQWTGLDAFEHTFNVSLIALTSERGIPRRGRREDRPANPARAMEFPIHGPR
jgi:hypothetical protein